MVHLCVLHVCVGGTPFVCVIVCLCESSACVWHVLACECVKVCGPAWLCVAWLVSVVVWLNVCVSECVSVSNMWIM